MSVHVLVLYPRETTKKKKEKKYSLHLLDGSHVNGSVSPLCIDEVVPTRSANVIPWALETKARHALR